jgi:hypothetical protein
VLRANGQNVKTLEGFVGCDELSKQIESLSGRLESGR